MNIFVNTSYNHKIEVCIETKRCDIGNHRFVLLGFKSNLESFFYGRVQATNLGSLQTELPGRLHYKYGVIENIVYSPYGYQNILNHYTMLLLNIREQRMHFCNWYFQ